VRQFRDSLPAAVSPLVIATLIVTFLLLAQLLLARLPTMVAEHVGGIAVSVAAYAVLRLPAGGYRLALMALGRDGGLRLLRRDTELDRARREMRICGDDAETFALLGVASPPAFPLDLAVKATIWAPVLLWGAENMRHAVDSSHAVKGELRGALLNSCRRVGTVRAPVPCRPATREHHVVAEPRRCDRRRRRSERAACAI